MCGIAGHLSLDGTPADVGAVRRMTDAMRRRGPDDEGIVVFSRSDVLPRVLAGADTPDAVLDGRLPYQPPRLSVDVGGPGSVCAIGHRRLSILDLSAAGHQPMCTADGRYWIAHNGEVYNHREIRAHLEARGERFTSDTDTEVVLRAYRAWGPDCLSRFNGMWALAIWDDAEKCLFLARDRVGIKPLHYVHANGAFLFASDVKTLLASGRHAPEVDLDGVYHAASFLCAPRPTTCFRGVRALEAGHWMTIDLDGRVHRQRYWSAPVGDLDESCTEDEWVERLDETLTRAVTRRLIADVPVGTYLSGGIDSTTMSAIAAASRPGVTAFTLSFRSGIPEFDRFDETEPARATARRHGMRHVVESVPMEPDLENMIDVVRIYEEPCLPFLPNFQVSRLAADHGCKVTLSGLGPDELFGGYGRERLGRQWAAMPWWKRAAGRLVPPIDGRLPRFARVARLRSDVECYLQSFSFFREDEKRALFGANAPTETSSAIMERLYPAPDRPFADDGQACAFHELHAYIGNDHLYREDQCSMHHSVECRVPYLDHEVVELAFRMPVRFKIRDGVGKHVLRRVAEARIDPSCLAQRKKGFALPMDYWLRGPLREMAGAHVARLAGRGLLEDRALGRIFAATEHGGIRAAAQLGFMIALELWLETFFDAPAEAAVPARRAA